MDWQYLSLAEKFRNPMRVIGLEIRRMREGEGDIQIAEKTGFQDIVTKADFHSEQALVKIVREHFPEDGYRAEEGAYRASQSGREWIFDPVDSTTNFACGPAFYAISAGGARDGRAEAGMVLLASGDFFFAARSGGAFVQRGRADFVEVEKRFNPKRLHESVVAIDFHPQHSDLFLKLKAECRNALILGGFVYATLLVAQGQLAAYVNTGATPFDMAASVLIAEEAGCVASRLDGSSIDLRDEKSSVVVAANQEILMQVLQLASGKQS